VKKIKTSILLLIILILIAGFFVFKFIGPATKKPDEKFLYIKTNTDLNSLKQQLLDEKILNTLTWFNLTTKLLEIRNVTPGKYEIPNGMSILNLVRMIRNGSETPVNFVVTKIRTKEQLAGKLARSFEFDSLAAINFLTNNDSLKQYHLDSNTIISAVLPLTYKSSWAVAPRNIFDKFYKAFNIFWTDERKQKAAQKNLSIIQVITLASIIDEETNATNEKGNIASVYLNRLQKGMPLGADPTVKFALKDFSIKRVLNVHLAVQSPYNTYKNKGLPPGPICTPMEETIDAVLNAPQTDYLYFVASAAFNGTHVFTTNYSDHLKYAKEYQAELNKRFSPKISQ
jgi:UPF0755 protein